MEFFKIDKCAKNCKIKFLHFNYLLHEFNNYVIGKHFPKPHKRKTIHELKSGHYKIMKNLRI